MDSTKAQGYLHVRRRAVPGKNGLHSKENSILDEHPESLVYVSGLNWKNVKKEHSHKSKGVSTIFFFPSNQFKDIYIYIHVHIYIYNIHNGFDLYLTTVPS